ncbi:M23 family metallopeptidase [Candidatus Dojkabacteria bacterium]|uniref:M23 family metallopeptidase n=1 Tax=Candidatus Dojkabacteria bacterium TaxID=2099670 RepID=A0A955RLC2_9BACT|nr:M23 family metallopeptidase [Candidatus Dojkabacteria bacterium]
MKAVVALYLWKHKWKILLALLFSCLFVMLGLEAIALQFTASQRAEILNISEAHRLCIEESEDEFNIEFELLASYGKVISDFDEEYVGEGIGFLEISEEDWQAYLESLEDPELELDYEDICTNYDALAYTLSLLEGDSDQKIELYTYPNREEVLEWYERYSGLMLIPYGNPLGLERVDLMTITSGYNVVRTIGGVRKVHKGVDFVPSTTWFSENPGLTAEQSINRAILPGEVNNFVDQYGALCTYVTNEQYRTLYCHCSAHLAEQGSYARYGDPICFMGNTGFSTGTHTHMAVYEKGLIGWNLIDPTAFFYINLDE